MASIPLGHTYDERRDSIVEATSMAMVDHTVASRKSSRRMQLFIFKLFSAAVRDPAVKRRPWNTRTRMLTCLTSIASFTPSSYTTKGAIEVDTNENSLFLWHGDLFLLENIPCYYSQHASKWDPSYTNASYTHFTSIILVDGNSKGFGSTTGS